MDLETFLLILSVLIPIVTLIIGYFLGLRSQKTQTLHEYIADVVKLEYPSLFAEIQRNIGILDRFLETPDHGFNFSVLTKFFNEGKDSLMKKHHSNLFLSMIHFRENIVPKFEELNKLRGSVRRELADIWEPIMSKNMPVAYSEVSSGIINDLIMSINPHDVLPDLLNERYSSIAKKVESCIREKTFRIREEESKRPFVIEGIPTDIDYEKITRSLEEMAKPKIGEILKLYGYLKEQEDAEIKEKLLPLLQKCISNPI